MKKAATGSRRKERRPCAASRGNGPAGSRRADGREVQRVTSVDIRRLPDQSQVDILEALGRLRVNAGRSNPRRTAQPVKLCAGRGRVPRLSSFIARSATMGSADRRGRSAARVPAGSRHRRTVSAGPAVAQLVLGGQAPPSARRAARRSGRRGARPPRCSAWSAGSRRPPGAGRRSGPRCDVGPPGRSPWSARRGRADRARRPRRGRGRGRRR